MKFSLLTLALSTLLAAAAAGESRSESPAAATASALDSAPAARPEPAPDFRLEELSGGWVALEDLRGTTVVIDFWATWCAPCESQVPILNAFYEAHREPSDSHRGGDGDGDGDGNGRVEVLGISADSANPDSVRAWTREKDVRYPVLLGDLELVERYVEAGTSPRLPLLVVVRPDGTIHSRHFGEISGPDLEAWLP